MLPYLPVCTLNDKDSHFRLFTVSKLNRIMDVMHSICQCTVFIESLILFFIKFSLNPNSQCDCKHS